MRKILIAGVAAMALLSGGCSGASETPSDPSSREQETATSDLTGSWAEKNQNGGDTWMEAVVTEETISIDWVSDGGDTRWIYWVGTFDPEVEGRLPQEVVSERNIEVTDGALLASSDATKEFTHEDGKLSFSQSAMGGTRTVVLEKQSESYDALAPSSEQAGSAVEIVDSGFGQAENSVQGIVIVTNFGEAAVGEYVTASVNFLDAEGRILATEEQVESFSWAGQELVLPVWLDPTALADASVSSIEPSVTISDYGTSGSTNAPLPVLESVEAKQTEFGPHTASFEFTNEVGNDLTNLRVGVVCYDETGEINGGGSTYLGLAPAGKTIAIAADVTVSGQPELCKAHLNYGA